MGDKNKKVVEVIIEGQVVPLSGFESEEYIQKLARYIDRKITEIGNLPFNTFLKTVSIAINIADDLFSEREKVQAIEEEFKAYRKKFNDDPKEKDEELQRYSAEIAKLEDENYLLKGKIKDLQTELMHARLATEKHAEPIDKKGMEDKLRQDAGGYPIFKKNRQTGKKN